MLPLPDGSYWNTTGFPKNGVDMWQQLFWYLDDVLYCIQEEGKPGWIPTNHRLGVVLAVPSRSEMNRQWGYTGRVSAELNSTSLGLVEVS